MRVQAEGQEKALQNRRIRVSGPRRKTLRALQRQHLNRPLQTDVCVCTKIPVFVQESFAEKSATGTTREKETCHFVERTNRELPYLRGPSLDSRNFSSAVITQLCVATCAFCGSLLFAFITWNSNLVPLLEGLCTSNPCSFEFSVFGEFCLCVCVSIKSHQQSCIQESATFCCIAFFQAPCAACVYAHTKYTTYTARTHTNATQQHTCTHTHHDKKTKARTISMSHHGLKGLRSSEMWVVRIRDLPYTLHTSVALKSVAIHASVKIAQFVVRICSKITLARICFRNYPCTHSFLAQQNWQSWRMRTKVLWATDTRKVWGKSRMRTTYILVAGNPSNPHHVAVSVCVPANVCIRAYGTNSRFVLV